MWMIEIWMISMPIIETKCSNFYILIIVKWNIVMDDWIWMKIHWVSDNICNIVKLQCPNIFTKNDMYYWVQT